MDAAGKRIMRLIPLGLEPAKLGLAERPSRPFQLSSSTPAHSIPRMAKEPSLHIVHSWSFRSSNSAEFGIALITCKSYLLGCSKDVAGPASEKHEI